MSTYLSVRDGGKTNEEGNNRALSQIMSEGVLGESDLLVSEKSGTPDMSVDVAVGDGFISEGDYNYHGWIDAVENVAVDASDPTNPRIDRVVMYIDKAVVSSATTNNLGATKFDVVAGTPAASPVAPTDGDVDTAVGAGNPWIELAQISVAALVSSITDANITDLRSQISMNVFGFAQMLKRSSAPATPAANNIRVYPIVDNGIVVLQLVDENGDVYKFVTTDVSGSLIAPTQLAPKIQSLSYGATVTPNWNNGNHQRLTINDSTGASVATFTLANGTNPVDGAIYTLEFLVTDPDGFDLTWGGKYKFPNDSEPFIDDTVNSISIITFKYNATADEYHLIGEVTSLSI